MTRFLLAVVTALAGALWIASAEAAHITSVEPEMGPTAGSVSITIRGLDFAPAGNSVMIGSRLCPVTSEAADEVVCTLPEGAGASHPIRIVDATGTASPPYPFAYSPPEITAVTAVSAPTAGGFPITIAGKNLGPPGVRTVWGLGGNAGRACIHDPSTPHSQMVCTAPAGVGHDLQVEVTIDGQTSAPSSFSYDPPVITAITPTRGAPSGGGRIITIRGENFGVAASVTVGGAVCPLEAQTHDRIECVLPPDSGAPPIVQVRSGGQPSADYFYSYIVVYSGCDSGKLKAVGNYAKCLATAEAVGAKKALEPNAAAFAKCDDKMAVACAKAEDKGDCSQPGTCGELLTGTKYKGWDGLIHGSTR